MQPSSAAPARSRRELRVTLPAIRHGLFAAAIFSFLVSWDEVVVAIFMASPTLQTLPVKIWTTLRQDLTPVIAAASTLLVALTIVLMMLAALLRKGFKTMTAPFLQIRGIRKEYRRRRRRPATSPSTSREGEFMTFLGPSGSGKSTTLYILAGFQNPTSRRHSARRQARCSTAARTSATSAWCSSATRCFRT